MDESVDWLNGLSPAAASGQWLTEHGYCVQRVDLLAGDVSPRRYLRAHLEGEATVVIALYPPELRGAFARYLATTALLTEHGVPVPTVRDHDPSAGVMVLEDVGSSSLFGAGLQPAAQLEYLRVGCSLLSRIQRVPADTVASLNPALGRSLFEKELALSWQNVLRPRGLLGSSRLTERLRRFFATLCQRLSQAPKAPCHRDFMVRNLMLRGKGLVVLDHQDLRLGPACYDLASLLNDSLRLSRETTQLLLSEASLDDEGRLQYHRAAAQRLLKIVGTFTRFAEQGCSRYLSLVSPSLRAALGHIGELPEAQELLPELQALWRRQIPEI